jgi:anti-sigma regulatory factor (Ser/Thr protein kinase)
VALAVGDVVGHGLQAAAIMGQLRTALRAYAVEGHPAAMVVDRVNYLMSSLGPNAMTTLAYLVLDPAHETLEMVNAGHPPPLVVDPSGEARFLTPPPGVALGATASAVHESATVDLPTGSIVFLYSDGLVERRRESIDVGLERLRSMAEGFTDPEALCRDVVSLVADGPTDDVAFIAARVPPLDPRLSTVWPARPTSLADIRHLLRRWLLTHGAGDEETYDIVVASQEACANVIEHAYGPGEATFAVLADLDDGVVRITVRDTGRWREPRGSNRGRGLPMMRALMDTVEVRDTLDGTDLVLARRLGRAS